MEQTDVAPCVASKNLSYLYFKHPPTLVHTAFFKPAVMNLLVVVMDLMMVVIPSSRYSRISGPSSQGLGLALRG